MNMANIFFYLSIIEDNLISLGSYLQFLAYAMPMRAII